MIYNYDFSRHLSDVQFEWLVRDILQIKLNIDLENFKDWKDWGIDIRYSENLEDKIIIQCKKYRNFSSLKSNLKKEVTKVKKLKWDFKYILVTSVWLSPKNKSDIIDIFDWIILNTRDILSEQDINNLLWQEKYKSIRNKYRYFFVPPWEENEVINIDYEVTYKIEEISTWLSENIDTAKEEIKKLDEKILKIQSSKKEKTDLEIKAYEVIWSIKTLFPNEEEWLKIRVKELKEYIDYLEKMKATYLNWKKLIFYITNNWNIYDENINIKVLQKEWIILDDEKRDSILRYIPDYPEDKWMFPNLLCLPYYNQNNEPPYKKELGKYHFELRDLHMGQKEEIFYNWEWIIIWTWDLEFEFEIKTKNAREIIKKKISIKY